MDIILLIISNTQTTLGFRTVEYSYNTLPSNEIITNINVEKTQISLSLFEDYELIVQCAAYCNDRPKCMIFSTSRDTCHLYDYNFASTNEVYSLLNGTDVAHVKQLPG